MPMNFDRRAFLAVLPARAWAQSTPAPATFVYKRAGGCEIKADVYGSGPPPRKPVLVWIHGGALIVGSRRQVPARLLNPLLASGFVIVSIDYRLAPETKLPGIIEDLKDAFAWVREQGPALFNGDPARVVAAGGSAGGYLTLMSGFCVAPPPRALVSLWGYGDITGPWYSRPDPFYNRQPEVPIEEARAVVGQAPVAELPDKHDRGRFYLYCRQKGLWPREVAGRDPDAESKWFDAYCPLRNVTSAYPPALLIHGTNDTDVPYEQSALMARRFEQVRVRHELITVEGGGHGLSGTDTPEVDKVYARAVGFLRESVSRPLGQ